MTILPNKKLKPASSKDERGTDRKRPRTSPYPPTGANLGHDRHPSTKKHHPSTSGLQKNKVKSKSRREVNQRLNEGKLVQCDPIRENNFSPREVPSYTPPLSPCLSAVRVPPVSTAPTDEVENSGYNSEDEYERNNTYSEERELEFRRVLREKRGFEIKDVEADGACLFRSVSDQIYGDEGMHDIIRAKCCDYMELNADYFRDWVTEDFSSYIVRKRILHTHGNHIELQAMSEQYGRLFEIYEYNHNPFKTFQCTEETDNPPIRLSYHNGNHYNSVRDPYRATIGIGLGIPHLNPGHADSAMLQDTLVKSEMDDTETRMLLDKTKHTDYQATDQALLAQVARESLQDFYKKSKKSSKNSNSLNKLSPCSSSATLKPSTSRLTPTSSPVPLPSPILKIDPHTKCSSPKQAVQPSPPSPVEDKPGPSNRSRADTQWALSDWVSENDEESVLEAILQQSAQEFYKKN